MAWFALSFVYTVAGVLFRLNVAEPRNNQSVYACFSVMAAFMLRHLYATSRRRRLRA